MRGSITEDDVKFLRARRQYILTRLATVSNGTTTVAPDGSGMTKKPRTDLSTAKARALAASPKARGSRGHGESTLPPGTHSNTDMTVRIERAPSREEDLYGHYLYRFQQAARDFWRTEKLCAMAERDYYREIRGNQRPHNESGPSRDKRILDEYAGFKSWEVAYWENCDPEAVRRLRISAFMDPEDGLEIEMDARTARIVTLKREGKSHREIATAMGVSAMTVTRALRGAAA